ncbi:MAG: gliding motility-associated ABC transporter permease subunit GldF [Saprospiraceae bacterium]|nr:gliding motility-associated ABC transporter permease subunit GldF [Saprospiraceae bacterium]
MWAIFKKEVNGFFSTLTGYVVVGVFLTLLGLIMWVFPDYSILDYNFASLDQLFTVAPIIFLFLIPAICMRSFSEEKQTGTIETLFTKPLTEWQIILGKYCGALFLLFIAIIPTLIYYYTIWQLGAPQGNIDRGEVLGSYVGLFFLAGIFIAISLYASVLSNNQIVAFLVGALLSFMVYWGFQFMSTIPFFYGGIDDVIQKIGIDYHYRSISNGAIDSRDVLYFLSSIFVFLFLTHQYLRGNRNQ